MRGHIIHLPGAFERDQIIFYLQYTLGWTLPIFAASDGSAWEADRRIAKIHPKTHQPVSKGILGCAHSHLSILEAEKITQEPIAIFEDDCVITAKREYVESFVSYAPPNWDILLLGANEYVQSNPGFDGYRWVGRFWGTHALLLRPRAMEAIRQTFQETQAEGIFMPADWLYNEAIRRYGLMCYGPDHPKRICRQAEGFVSAITGEVRSTGELPS
jgi:GR25 family glycosyltransferase involved in LPS biosynthesis